MIKQRTLSRPMIGWLIFLGVMLVVGAVIPARWGRLCIMANYSAIFAISWDILCGATGYVSFGHPFIIGVAGYTTAILAKQIGMPLYATMPIGIAAGMGAGMLFFLPGLRLRGNYFCIVTLAAMIIIHQLVVAVRTDLTGGSRGLTAVPALFIGMTPNYYLSFILLFCIALGMWYVLRSDAGMTFNAIRMDEDTVSGLGLSTFRFKLIAFTLSALVGAVGGVFFTHYIASIAPGSIFGMTFMLSMILATLVGGLNTIIGPIIGAYFITFLLGILRPYIMGPPRFVAYALICFGLYIAKSRGIYGIVQDAVNWYRQKKG